MMEVLAIVVIGTLVLAAVPAGIAADKGRSWLGFYVFGLLFFLPALIVALVIARPAVRRGELVKVRRTVRLDDGTTVPRGWCSRVLDLDAVDGEAMVKIESPYGPSWVSTLSVAPA